MNKQDFIKNLQTKLHGLPKQEVQERLNFYSEMIDDRIEEGLSEEEAVFEIGSIDEIASQIISDKILVKNGKQKIKPKRQMKGWEIALLAIGSPIWLSLALAAFAITLSFFVVLWALIISLWALFASFIACAIGGVASGVIIAISDSALAGIAAIGASIFCAGLAILVFFGCKAATKGAVLLIKKIFLGIKGFFVKKEIAQ